MFENRQNQTITSSFKITSENGRKVFLGLNVIFPWVASSISLLRTPNQDSAKLEMLKIIPCPTLEYFELPIIIVTTEAKTIGAVLFALLIFIFSQTIFFILHSSFYLCKSTTSLAVSERTKKLKRKYFLSVCIQVIIPIVIMAFPVSYFVLSIVTDYYSQSELLNTLNNLILFNFSG